MYSMIYILVQNQTEDAIKKVQVYKKNVYTEPFI